ncbi:uncharacterized protein LOC122715893 [Apis laboriosa]|uniref:uncharacterized protein LOC122715893 n=1 Tax=Apis laboriosa TaxID=183418 RepID=UPI001CC78F77|nr:uncharacterized protein LOC122715893 [Apis laboriosa]
MQMLIKKKQNKYNKKKNNHKEKKKYKDKVTKIKRENKEEEDKKDDEKKETQKKLKKPAEDVTVFTSAIDPYDVPLQWWETEHIRYAINYPPVKFRLEKVMGSHIVRLTDRKYMILLMAKLYEDHVEQQNIRIEKRKLPLPSMMSRLLEISYKTLFEKMQESGYGKLKLYE